MKLCPHCSEKMPDHYIVCTACHKELVPQKMPSIRTPSVASYNPSVRPALGRGDKLGWGKWIQIFLGTVVYMVVFLGPLIQQGNVQIPWSGHLPGAMGQEGKLFLTGDPAIPVAKTKADLLALRGMSSSSNQAMPKGGISSRGSASKKSSNKLAHVPAGSAVRVLDTSDGLCRVIVLDGRYEGTMGWVDSVHVASNSRQEGQ
jgi:hypothetical protein